LHLDIAEEEPGAVIAAMDDFVRCLTTVRLGGKPTIALVDGAALGGGLGLAAACDVLLATERASFGLPEALFGLVPATIFPLLLERLPAQRARLLALDPLSRSAGAAITAVLADQIVPVSERDRALARWIRALGRGAPGAVAMIKRLGAEQMRAAIERGA